MPAAFHHRSITSRNRGNAKQLRRASTDAETTKIVIEIDGSQHFDSKKDQMRDAKLAREGFRVLRYWNNAVLQRTDGVLEDILAHLDRSER